MVFGQDHRNVQKESYNYESSHDQRHTNSGAQNKTHTHLKSDYSHRDDAGNYDQPVQDNDGYTWWKGNLHTHTLWSDGDQFPEVSIQWYKKHGYNFLALSDHNTLLEGQKWVMPGNNRFTKRGGGMDVYELYSERFDNDWIETQLSDEDKLMVRVKPLQEIRALFQEAGRFIMIDSEEISVNNYDIHVNATNIMDYIEPQSAISVEETIRLNIDAVINQRKETGQVMLPHLNHPNFQNAVTAENMAPVENLRLFEIYNGHRGVLNFGNDDGVKDLERVWDIVLTKRLGEMNLSPVYGVAVDDAHHYENSSSDIARPGRGWVMVRSRYLTPEHIVLGLESGNFYSSTGVRMQSIIVNDQNIKIEVLPENGVEYTIQFIGTKEGYDSSSLPYVDKKGEIRNDRSRIYSDEIGQVLQESKGLRANYEFAGDELYVRARVISSKSKENFFYEGEKEKAWLQPILPND